ncbi:MAG: hypothetical protein A2Z88_04495 [Omnitrophica WOR_2 bacterium GWA2_47_8]|nr:MAG: hypothetical protein A2Z88_04495 [Omnitrophica WOR_2 bacterium GWA2_47_8]
MSAFSNFFPTNVVTFTSDRTVNFAIEKSVPFSEEQKRYLKSQAPSLNLDHVFNIRQVHGNKVVVASLENVRHRIEQADAVITNTPDVVISVRTADCVPIFLYDSEHHAVGLVHAGWQGTQKTIVVQTIRMMNSLWATQTTELKAAFGPAIRKCCYQVGEEFRRYFPRETEKRPTGFYLDLVKANHSQLLSLRVKKENIFDSQTCTHCSPHLFSYRREKDQAGRLISVMMLKN